MSHIVLIKFRIQILDMIHISLIPLDV